MKNLILFVAMTLVSLNAFSAAREFRINGYSANDGYAIAWGIPGKLIDFEEVEKDEEKVSELWTEMSSMRNYLVDLQTNQILATITEEPDEFVAIRLGGMGTNHFSMNTLSLGNYYTKNDECEIVGVFESFKWSTSLSSVFVISKKTLQPVVVKRINDLDDRMLAAAKAALTPAQVAQFDKGAVFTSIKEAGYDEQAQEMYQITWESSVPKSMDDPMVTVTARLKLKLTEANDVTFVIDQVKYAQEN
ncbi:hypothetical protein ACLVWU_07185 [Bdellovibrio sp. HCB290]|uniref:hypothetical protein n=1 Tax=Bdellovibrio sp. HCB290 TaxID=3394356 RepID=UPI0039B5E60C